jgi:hypothetical protein
LEALKGERTVFELAAAADVHPTMMHQRKKALHKGRRAPLSAVVSWLLRPRLTKIRTVTRMPRSENWPSPTIFWQESSILGPGSKVRHDRTQPSQVVSRGAVPPDFDLAVIFSYAPQGEATLNLDLMPWIGRQFLDTPFSGARQLTWHLQNEGHAVNEKRIRRLTRLMRLIPIYQKTYTSKPTKGQKTYPCFLGKLPLDRSKQVWCAYMT